MGLNRESRWNGRTVQILGRNLFNLSKLLTTETELMAMAAEAIREVPLGGLGPKNLERNWDKRLGKESFEAAEKLIDEWHGKENGRITCRVAPMAPDRWSEGLLDVWPQKAESLL